MAKSQALELIGEILDVLPAGKYKVKLHDMDFVITGYKSGNMKRNNIVIMLGDYVKIEINEYDNTQGRITYRYKYPPAEVTGHGTVDQNQSSSHGSRDVSHTSASVSNGAGPSTTSKTKQPSRGNRPPSRRGN